MPQESAAAVAEPVEVPAEEVVERRKEEKKQKPKKLPPYHVILWNDDDHTYAYVVNMLQTVFGFPVERGYQLAVEVDTRGRVIVLTTTKEHAELKRDQIHAYGKDKLIKACKGSMSATIEPAT